MPASLGHQRGGDACGVRRLPAEEAAPAASTPLERGRKTTLAPQPQQPGALADGSEAPRRSNSPSVWITHLS